MKTDSERFTRIYEDLIFRSLQDVPCAREKTDLSPNLADFKYIDGKIYFFEIKSTKF